MSEDESDERAGLGLRAVAAFIDGTVFLLVERFVVWLVGPLGLVIALVLAFAYLTYFEGSVSGQTPGKRAMSIRVVDAATGGALRPGAAALRYLGRFVSALPLFVGYLWAIWDPSRQTWHDKIAHTCVVHVDTHPVGTWPGAFGRSPQQAPRDR